MSTTAAAVTFDIEQSPPLKRNEKEGRFSELRKQWHVIAGGLILLMVYIMQTQIIYLLRYYY